ncbi:hypothetical protein I4U23_022353 [Adineta vaga]|nr:hypothetical protein I4U23_022353 [Adineta vaga]
MWDIMNGNDEKNCLKWICHEGLIKCNRTGQCIEHEYICDVGDGQIDCIGAHDGRNVLSCPVDHRMIGDHFLCDNGTKCIHYLAICNGIKDCMDETDELICYWNIGMCLPETFPCANENKCVSMRCKSDLKCYDQSQSQIKHIIVARSTNHRIKDRLVESSSLYIHVCKSNQTCNPRSDLPIYRHMCICNTTNCKPDRPIIILNRQEPNESPFLIQSLQLTGNYPTIRYQILIQPLALVALIKTIKTRDKRDLIGPLPEIGLLYSFKFYANST